MEKKTSWLYWERKAFDEIKTKLIDHWNTDKKTFVELSQENKKLPGVEIDEYPDAKTEIKELFHHVITLWKFDPIINRIMVHNALSPEDIETRSFLRENYLSDDDLKYYRNQLSLESVVEDSELAKADDVKGIPVHRFMVGAILGNLLSDYQHFRMIDEVKKTGAPESIAELRESRIEVTRDGCIYDYTPLCKEEVSFKSNCVTREIFDKAEFERLASGGCKEIADGIDDSLCFLYQKTAQDKRKQSFLGFYKELPKIQFIIRHGAEQFIIPGQLLPKWTGDIGRKSIKYSLSAGGKKKELISDEALAAIEAIRSGALKWDKKISATAWLRMSLTKGMGEAFDKVSTEALSEERFYAHRKKYAHFDEADVKKSFKKRILKEEMEHSGGSLDADIDPEDKKAGRRIDFLEDEDTLDPESEVTSRETRDLQQAILGIARNDKRLMKILVSEARRTPADQKYYERKITEIKKKFNLKKA